MYLRGRCAFHSDRNQESIVARLTGDLLPDRRSAFRTVRASCCVTGQYDERAPEETGRQRDAAVWRQTPVPNGRLSTLYDPEETESDRR